MEDPFKKSVVHEFVVLYTDKVTEKNKRWFDGTLRYFDLNGKVQLQNLDGIVISEDFTNRTKEDVLNKLLIPTKKYTFPNKSVLIDILEKSSTNIRDVSFLHKVKNNKIKEELKRGDNKIGDNIKGIIEETGSKSTAESLPLNLPRIPKFSSRVFRVYN